MGKSGEYRSDRVAYTGWAVLLVVFLCLSGCKLQYNSEEFSLKIAPDGKAKLSVLYKNFGSGAEDSKQKNIDYDMLKKATRDNTWVKKAAAKGVTITKRRIDYIGYTLNGYVEATAPDFRTLFDFFSNYDVSVEDGVMYILPQNGIVVRAEKSEGGKIVKRNGRLGFSWPMTATDISFKADYKVSGTSFRHNFQQRYEGGG